MSEWFPPWLFFVMAISGAYHLGKCVGRLEIDAKLPPILWSMIKNGK